MGTHSRLKFLLFVAFVVAASSTLATTPQTTTVQGALTAVNGTPVVDGSYDLTFRLYASKDAKTPLWQEGPAAVKSMSGSFAHVLGAKTPLTDKVLATKGLWLSVQVAKDPELPRQPLHAALYAMRARVAEEVACSGCLTAASLADGAVSAAKVGFTYAGSKTKGGAAVDLACSGCVSVGELKFDGDVNLGAFTLKAKAAIITGDLAAAVVTAQTFIGDGSKLTGINLPSGKCAAGQVVTAIAGDGTITCAPALVKLPGDGLNEVSGELLTNEFKHTSSLSKAVPIPDNTGAVAEASLTMPKVAAGKGFRTKVKVTNSDLSKLAITLSPPTAPKGVVTLCDPCGKKDEKKLETSYPDASKPKAGDLSTWASQSPEGVWKLQVKDTAFCVPQAPGNAAICNFTAKLDGQIDAWSIEADYQSATTVSATHTLRVNKALVVPNLKASAATCDAAHRGAIYYDVDANVFKGCNGQNWEAFTSGVNSQDNAAKSCAELLKNGKTQSGLYWLAPNGGKARQVYCDQQTNGGGWALVFHVYDHNGMSNNKFISAIGHDRFTDATWQLIGGNIVKDAAAQSPAPLKVNGALDIAWFKGQWDDLRMTCNKSSNNAAVQAYGVIDGYATANGNHKLLGAAANGKSYSVNKSLNSQGNTTIWVDNETDGVNSGHYLCDTANGGSNGTTQFGLCYTNFLNNDNSKDMGDSIVAVAFGSNQGDDGWSKGFSGECGPMGSAFLSDKGTFSIWVR